MLSSEYIHEKILDTTSCSSEDVRKLAELMELYPYVSSFPILYLKALANSKDVRLESEIEKYAYRISSRAVLFELLNPRFEVKIASETQIVIQEEEVKNPISETIEVEEEVIPEVQVKIVEVVENPISEAIEVEEEIVPEVQVEILEVVENPISETIEVEEEIIPEVQVEILEVVENPISEKIEVEEEIIPVVQAEIVEGVENPVSETIEVEEEKIPEVQAEIVEVVENPISETIEVEEEKIPEVQAEIVEVVENPISETIEVEEEIIPKEESEEFKRENDQLEQLIQAAAISSSFMETNFHEEVQESKLEPEIEKTHDSEFVAEKKIEKITIVEKTEIEPKSERSFSSWLSLGATTTAVNPIETTVILEETKEPEIEEEPKKTEYYNFEKPKKEFYSPVKKAKESLSENNMPVSETLAKIFALQGNYPKSIYVYEQLILIFPEKKSFFATQIKNLKKKLNS